MGSKTSIEWTAGRRPDGTVTSGSTWNPVTGCSHVSPGCTHCYAERLSARFGWTKEPWGAQHVAENVKLHPDRLDWPMRWRRPRRIFVCSMADLFHEQVPDAFIDLVFWTMTTQNHHVFQVLTKRPGRMASYLAAKERRASHLGPDRWPPPNVWLGVSCEDQRRADERIPLLLQTPAAVRFVSCEPLLGPLVLTRVAAVMGYGEAWTNTLTGKRTSISPGGIAVRNAGRIDWVIVGGESGGPTERRLVERCRCWDPDGYKGDCRDCYGTGCAPKEVAIAWVRSLRDQCQTAGVPFFLKGWGGMTPRSGGALLDGREWREYPAELAMRSLRCEPATAEA